MKLASLIDEKFGLPGNAGREFGEKYVKEFINPGKFAELWTAFEATYPELQPQLKTTFEKTNDLFKYIKPEKGGEAYRVSTLPEVAAQELDEYLDNILAAIDELSNLDKAPDEKTVSDAIQYFDGLFQDMLNIFTSNTAGDAPLEPYKKTNIGFGSPQYVNEDSFDETKKALYNNRDKIGNFTFKALQSDLMLGNEAHVRSWLIKNGYMDEEKLPFEEIDALHENEEYCPKCVAKIKESIKKLVAECWKTHKQVGMKKKGNKMVPNCVPKNEEVDEAKRGPKPAKGKRFAKKVKGKGGRTRTISYGQAGKAKGGGDRIRPGTKKGHAYCARSAKIKKCKNPPCANTLSRKKWKCQGSRSVAETKKMGEDVLGSSKPIGLSDLPVDLAKTAANKGSGRAPDAVYAGPGGDDAQNLKPSQQQIILVKAFNMAMNTTPAGGKFEPGGDIGAIISKDGFIMDGHHRWASTILVKPDASVKGERIGLPAKDLITALNVYTKGVIGKQSGNPGQGAISEFTGENIQSKIIDVAEKTGKSPDHPDAPGYEWEDLKQRITKVGDGDYQKGLDFIKTNANIISSKKIESWMPDRDDMPVIQKDQLADVEKKFASGELDLKPPFDPATKVQMKKAGLGGDDSEPDVQTKRKAKLRTALKEFYNLS
jgi:hypothetical protein